MWHPNDFCKKGYYGINYKNVPVCGKEDYKERCIKEQCELWCKKEKGLPKFFVKK